MKNERFVEILGSVHQALEHANGKRRLRTTTFPLRPKPLNGRAVKRVRVATRSRAAAESRSWGRFGDGLESFCGWAKSPKVHNR